MNNLEKTNEENLLFNILANLFKGVNVSKITKLFNITTFEINELLSNNSDIINTAIIEVIPKEWQDRLNDDIYNNITIYSYYLTSLTVKPEFIDLKTKKTYLNLLELSTNGKFTNEQSKVLSSLLGYFSKHIQED